jgi:hypothetical protein
MRYIQIYESFTKPFNNFNNYVYEIINQLDKIYATNTIVLGVIDKNAGKIDIKGHKPNGDEYKIMIVEVKYIGHWKEPYIEIMINRHFEKRLEYLKKVTDSYCVKYEEVGDFDVYGLDLNNYNDFLKELLEYEMRIDAKKYNL